MGLLVVFLDDLLEARVVQLGELGQVMNVGDDIREVFFQEFILHFGWSLSFGSVIVTGGFGSSNDLVDVFLTGLDAANDFLTLDFLESKDLVEFLLKEVDEMLLVFFGPGFSFRMSFLNLRRVLEIGPQTLLELVV